jgi:hypothetical protein
MQNKFCTPTSLIKFVGKRIYDSMGVQNLFCIWKNLRGYGSAKFILRVADSLVGKRVRRFVILNHVLAARLPTLGWLVR